MAVRMGYDRELLKKSIMAELGAAYGMIFAVMGISSVFSVGALAKMMFTNLVTVNAVSVTIVFFMLVLWYILSVKAYGRNAGVE